MYKILGADGKEYGPASVEDIKGWIDSKRANAQTYARLEGTDQWKTLDEFTEFQEILSPSKASTHPPGTPPPIPSSTAPRPLPTPSHPTSHRLAATSLGLGILSMSLCPVIGGIPAVITGHLALNKARREPERFGGNRMALAGCILGYVSLVLVPFISGMLSAILLPTLAQAKAKAQRIDCISHIKQIGLAARIYANDHHGKFPPDFISMAQELHTPQILICPADPNATVAVDWSLLGRQNVSYEFLTPGINQEEAMTTIVFQCQVHHNVGYGDGSAQMLPEQSP